MQYLPVVSEPPDYDVLKEYIDFLLATTDDLGIQHIFTHADEAVNAKLLHIIWNQWNRFKKIIPLIGGFHQIMALQKILYKRHTCIGYKTWFEDAQIIASGSVDKAIEGRHYHMRIHKEAFHSIVQMLVAKLTQDYSQMNPLLLSKLVQLRYDPSPDKVKEITTIKELCDLKCKITSTTGTQSKMSMLYLKDINLMLSIVDTVRGFDLETHLEAVREMLKLVFAFDHVNYAVTTAINTAF